MKVIAVCNRKGGCGKTTTTGALSSGLTSRGYRVLTVDLDGQAGNLTRLWGVVDCPVTSFDVLVGSSNAREAIQHTPQGDIIPGGPKLSTVDLKVTGENKERRLKLALNLVKDEYDFVLIDTAPGFGTNLVNALAAANYVIITVIPDVLSLAGLSEMKELIASVKQVVNPELIVSGVLLTRFQPRSAMCKGIVSAFRSVASKMDTKVFETRIRESLVVWGAQAKRSSLFAYSKRSNPARDYMMLIDELLAGFDMEGTNE